MIKDYLILLEMKSVLYVPAGPAFYQGGGYYPVRVAGQFVGDLVQKGVHSNGCKQLLGLFYGGKIYPGQSAVADVVEAQKGYVARDVYP